MSASTTGITPASGNGLPSQRRFDPLAPVASPGTLKGLLATMEKQIAEILPRHVTASRIMKSALVAVNRQPALLDCTQASIMKSIMEAAELGLDPSGGTLGQGYLVPFNNKVKQPDGREVWLKQAQFIPGYRGLCDLARRGGDVKLIESHVIYRGDHFEYELGTKRHLKHVPGEHDERDEDITHVYAIAWLSDEEFQFDVMTRTRVEKIRARSKAKDRGPWVTDYAEMCRKTVIRRLVKYLPISSERLAKAIDTGDRNEFGASVAGSMVEGAIATASSPVRQPKSAGDDLADHIAGNTEDNADSSVDQGSPGDDGQPSAPSETGTPSSQSASPDDAPTVPEFTDYAAFYAACEGIAAEHQIANFDTAMKALPANGYDVKSARRSKALPEQQRVYVAMRDGQFDWATSKIIT